ncbi:hypothetical protein Tco_0913839 [Tanacetum coccineum]
MKGVFESTESELDELEKQNDFLKDQLLEASLKHDVEMFKKKSFEIQEGLQARIKILEKDFQRCQKQSVDFELQLQHEKEKHKWDSTSKNKNTNPRDYSWISKLEKLENVSLDFKVQSLIKERDNVKLEYQKLFDSIKKTRSQTQMEMDELIVHVSKKTYAYGAIRAENQNLLSTISELKTRLEKVEKGTEASKVKTLLCVSCMQNVLIPCHDKCLEKHILNVHSNVRRTFSTNSRTPKSLETTYVAPKTRFSKKETQSKTLDTTCVVYKSKIDVESASKAKDKVVQIVLWVVDSGCSKHMTGDRSLLRNFIKKFIGTIRFGYNNFAAITGYGDYIHGNITICHVYYVEGHRHNLFSVGQFFDRDLEVAFCSNTCYVRILEGNDLLTGGRDSNLYTISISDMVASSPVCLMSKATSTKLWLWH